MVLEQAAFAAIVIEELYADRDESDAIMPYEGSSGKINAT